MPLSQATPFRDPAPSSGRPELAPQSRPRVLVLLAAYNGSHWIQEQVDSILAQHSVDVRLVIRDEPGGLRDRALSAPADQPRKATYRIAERSGGHTMR